MRVSKRKRRIAEAISVLADLGMPQAQQNERSALALLALLDLPPTKDWSMAEDPLMGITPIMDWARTHYDKNYAPNTRETVRRQTMHQFVQAGIALYNPDKRDRPVNSPHAVYRIEPSCLEVLRVFGSSRYKNKLAKFLETHESLAEQYAKHRQMEMVPLRIADNREIRLSPGEHSELIRAIWEEFGPRYVPGGRLVYAGDTGQKWGYFDAALLASLGVVVDNHGKMPDVAIYYPERNWLILAEAVTSHGPVDAKRHKELLAMFRGCTAGLVFLSAFPSRKTFTKYLEAISWETEVWIADNPTHLIHFNGATVFGAISRVKLKKSKGLGSMYYGIRRAVGDRVRSTAASMARKKRRLLFQIRARELPLLTLLFKDELADSE